jgi:hypothetical protein
MWNPLPFNNASMERGKEGSLRALSLDAAAITVYRRKNTM